ncbi:NRPS [Trichoderma virens]|nr:NRPS [Trichoderma virens]
MHHSIFDGWSMGCIMGTLDSIYRENEPQSLAQYARFVKYTMGLDRDAARKYWLEQLHDAKCASFPSNATTTSSDDPLTSYVSKKVDFTNYHKTSITKASIIRAAWAIVLARYCDTTDICFGATVSGRNAPVVGADSMPGVMLATVPVRVQLDKDQTVFNYLSNIQEQSAEMVAHEQFGLPNISSLSANAKDACNFSSLLVIQPAGFFMRESQDSGAILIDDSSEQDMEDRIQNFINYPLVVQGLVYDKEVEIVLMYNTNCMTKSQAVAVSEQLNHVIQQLLSNTEQVLGSISVTGHWDLQQAIRWNAASLEPADVCLHGLVSKQAQRRPECKAIYFTGGSISFAELDLLSSQLAIFLNKEGVRPESFVPICFEKSPWAIVAMLGILKAGGAFIPLDPSHPVARRQALIDEVGAQIMIVSSSVATECAHLTKTMIELSPTLISYLSGIKKTKIANTATPTSAAYMLFTSGSTSKPKGVIVEHQGICTSLLGEHKAFNTNENSRWFQFANYVFDACITEIFAALTAGGTVCVPTETERMHQTAKFIMDAQVNIALLTPTVIKTLAPESVPSLKTLILGGEAASKDIIETWYGQLDLRNAYGPAEACIASSAHIYTSPTDSATTIGRGFAHHCWIVDPDDYQQLAPIGCIGELLVQGPALARGYFKDESKTRSSFVEDVSWLPIENTRFRRFYKTGDLVRYGEDGIMEYLGRKDTQIKIRGQRIEVGEIEYQMKRLEATFEHVAVDIIQEKSLAAFVSFRTEGNTDGVTGNVKFRARDDTMGELFSRTFANLSRVLPQHMMPSYVIPVANMPHNSAGKLDRKLLLQTAAQLSIDDLAQYLSGQRTIFRDCSNETERWIRSQWAHVLNLPAESISVDDNFYQLGGDSIRIVTLAKAILNEYEVSLGLSILNSKHTTVSNMAKFIQNAYADTAGGTPNVDLMEKIKSLSKLLSASNLTNLTQHPVMKLSRKSAVFLTGATGFLGTELLRQLLRNSSVKSVIALVRCNSPQHGLERIRTTAQAARWWRKHDAKKIEVWVGDLGKPQLGLNASQWEQLSGTSTHRSNVNAIVHNGAVVNWNADYDKLVAPNVNSTIDLLNAAASSPVNPRFVFVSGGLRTDPDEHTATVATQLDGLNGYVQTKFVCESVIQDVVKSLPREQNRLSIVKPGRIIGSANNGVANVDDLIWRVVSGAAAMHAYPVEPLENWMYIADVDSVASAVLRQVFHENAIDSFVHVTGGMPTPVFWEKVNEELDMKCKPVSWAEWKQSAHVAMAEAGDKHPLWPVQHFLGALGAPRSAKELATESSEHEQWHKAVKKNVQHLMEIGFIASSVGELGNVKDGAIKRLH